MTMYAAPADQFSSYDQAIDQTLTGILDGIERPPNRSDAIAPEAAAVNPNLDDGERLRRFAARFWGGREDQLRLALTRLAGIEPTLRALLKAEGVPENLIAVVLIESAAQPLALSPRNARGLWQLIPETARRYGLTVDSRTDERIQVGRATRAAAQYLHDLYGQFRDWQLALAAYNAGEEAVEKALTRSHSRSFAELNATGLLPQETRKYVPAVTAAMDLLSQPDSGRGRLAPGRSVIASARAPE